ncbi:MAG TPA: large-conductance mechanosensitive channel protein MscL [Candidatus Aminicenantes bacterium]|nr:large-conductance mechanosensitive channel protein MscL [Candidatus Aminicenantes bacterium]HRY65257.1 large-conductance mechanosensitive channel protein MscL [Candidatus Aminicenantes bacterium]HRZ72275.1 large-conductance mechanosensitive channel protein MscL [Candidatus Aminicenantes bacterium]
MFKEFKEFAMRGSVLDMAVGIILGGAFGGIVSSLVNDVLMPPIGLLLGRVDFSQLSVALSDSVTLNYGRFINTIITFVIVAFCLFLIIRAMNRLQKKAEAPAPAPTTKDCPYCATAVPLKAVRCPHCTSELK